MELKAPATERSEVTFFAMNAQAPLDKPYEVLLSLCECHPVFLCSRQTKALVHVCNATSSRHRSGSFSHGSRSFSRSGQLAGGSEPGPPKGVPRWCRSTWQADAGRTRGDVREERAHCRASKRTERCPTQPLRRGNRRQRQRTYFE